MTELTGVSSGGRRAPRIGQTRPLTLPASQETVEVCRPSTFTLIVSGGLPAELSALVWKLFGTKMQLADVMETGKELKDFALLIEKFIPFVLVDPVIGEVTACVVGEDGRLHGTLRLADLPDLDKNHLFLYGVGVLKGDDEEVVAADLVSFPGESPRGDAGPGGEALRNAPLGAGGDAAH